MSDFIYSSKQIHNIGLLTSSIQSIYEVDDRPKVREFHGKWGSLAVSHSLYNGFNSYENERHITIVIGGPVLMYQDNGFIKNENSSEGTISIYERWSKSEIKWDEDLSGPFVILIINKQTSEILCVTDIMSFIPVYSFNSSNDLMLSTHVDILAKISKESENVDTISELDFILHGIITYPYTSYKNIYQIPPASEHRILNDENHLNSIYYWLPTKTNLNLSMKETSVYLRKVIKEYVEKITSVSKNIAQFISAGEDSRLLSALLEGYNRDAFVFLDHMNREGKIARKITNIYKGNFRMFTRDPLHYLHIMQPCSDLVGSGSQYHHAHTYNFHKECNLKTYDAVFGGLFADALLKGARIKRIRRSGKLPFFPELKNRKYSVTELRENPIFHQESLAQIADRRQTHLDYVRKYRHQSAEEWFELWPSSMNKNIPNVHANRRLFRSYEPFLSNKVVKLSSTIPQKWKLNRLLFHKMAKPLLRSTKGVPHGDGWYPHYSWILKSITYPFMRAVRKCLEVFGVNKGVQGPWGNWNKVVSSREFSQSMHRYASSINELRNIFKEKDIFNILNSDYLNTNQKVNLLQVLYKRK